MARRVGLVTYDPAARWVHPDPEISELVAALRDAGVEADAPPWSIPRAWDAYDLLVIKSPWDYSMRPDEFSAWLDATERRVPILNSPWTIRWNIDKRYLRDLADAGAPTQAFFTPSTIAEGREHLADLGSRDVVVKPTVSAGSRNTGLFRADDAEALALVASILEQGKTPMVMDALPDVAVHGERSLVVFDGKYSHAARKAPILALGGGYLGGHYTETITPDQPLADEVEVAEFCIEYVRRLGLAEGLDARTATPLYARIDIARDRNGPSVLELELFEPNYFTVVVPSAWQRFVAAVQSALERLDD